MLSDAQLFTLFMAGGAMLLAVLWTIAECARMAHSLRRWEDTDA